MLKLVRLIAIHNPKCLNVRTKHNSFSYFVDLQTRHYLLVVFRNGDFIPFLIFAVNKASSNIMGGYFAY